MRYYVVALFAVLLDQYSKWYITTKMELYASVSVINDFFYITSHRNRGAAFGILQNQYVFFVTVTFVVALVLSYCIWKFRSGGGWFVLSLALILGGAIGNFIDRIRTGEVVDFLDFQFGTYHFPVFNVADSVIVVGVSIVIFLSVFHPQIYTDKHNGR